MTLTINRKAYGDLLAEIQPHLITNDAENEIALQNMERLLAIPQPTAEEERILQLLLTLIAFPQGVRREARFHRGESTSPHRCTQVG